MLRPPNRKKHGSSLVETVMGSIIIVMIVLFLVDVASIVICQTQNDALAKHCARAASNKENSADATTAVNDVVSEFQTSGGGSKLCIFDHYDNPISYNAGNSGAVLIRTYVVCNFPVPIPFGPSSMMFVSEAVEPIVATVPTAAGP